MAATTPTLSPGTRLGKYEIIRPLAVGGMAELFLVRAHGIEGFAKQVVLKRILPHLVSDKRFVGMFLDEARLAAHLHHPNVAQVYNIGEIDGNFFFTMEYVDGHSLLSVLRTADWATNGLPLAPALNIALGLTAGLHYAHELADGDGKPLSIVHRDVSPSNILISHDGSVKLVDFGIAKATSQRTATGAHTVKGKLRYMSPQQLTRGHLDRRSDVFSAGIVLYEMTTGHRLFDGANHAVIIGKIFDCEFPPPSQVKARYPKRLEGIVMRALGREPEQRYATALDMQLALSEFALDEKIMTSPLVLSKYLLSVFGDRAHETAVPTAPGSQEHVRLVSSPQSDVAGAARPAEPVFTRPRDLTDALIRNKRRWPLVVGGLVALLLASWGVRVGVQKMSAGVSGASTDSASATQRNKSIDWVTFEDIQGIRGGRSVYWQTGHDAIVLQVTRTASGLAERRFTVAVSSMQLAELETLMTKVNFAKMTVPDRPGIPDEARAKIRVRWRSGREHAAEKWNGVTHADFSTLATWLNNLTHLPAKAVLHEGPFPAGFAPDGPWSRAR